MSGRRDAAASPWVRRLAWLGCGLGYLAAADGADSRLRTEVYSADEVYRLRAYVGYQIELQFEPSERFVGLGAGDAAGLSFVAQGNRLFIKPKAASVHTNLTVMTTLHDYHFDYETAAGGPDVGAGDVLYLLRFAYPAIAVGVPAAVVATSIESPAGPPRQRHADYWYCGSAALQPAAAWDDGVQTHLEFAPGAELPAVFVRNEDGSESLLNFHVEDADIVVERLARRLVLRRGKLQGCVVNRGFVTGAALLPARTLVPGSRRVTTGVGDELVR